MELRGLNWHGQKLEDGSELWPNLKGAICNLTKIKKSFKIGVLVW